MTPRWFLGPVTYLTALVVGIGCSADLHDVAGPLVPSPNVTGRVVRERAPVVNAKVEIEIATQDSILDRDYTDGEGRFGFTSVPAGTWRVRAESTRSGDFARVSFDFHFATDDSTELVPDLELTLGDFEIEQPAAGAVLPVPGFFSPLDFKWHGTEGRLQVRVYRQEDGVPVWFSEKVRGTRIRWNGFGNMPGFEGRSVSAGSYRWRIALDDLGAYEYVTAFYDLELEP